MGLVSPDFLSRVPRFKGVGIIHVCMYVFIAAASHSWLQRALSDFGHNISSFSPALGRVLLKRLNPITLLIFGGAATLALTQILIDLELVVQLCCGVCVGEHVERGTSFEAYRN